MAVGVLRWLRVPTDLIEIDQQSPDGDALDRAADAIRAGRVVAIPTDALYALVADPFSLRAVREVYRAKGREINRALPMLVSDAMMVEELAREITPRFRLLARKFWPGPLTMILQAAAGIPLRATGNTGRLGVRHAESRVVDGLLERLGQPVIATSANISGHPTCSSGIEVFGMMDGRVDLVLDGGFCGGVGATTIDISGSGWKVLKEGAVLTRELAECLDIE